MGFWTELITTTWVGAHGDSSLHPSCACKASKIVAAERDGSISAAGDALSGLVPAYVRWMSKVQLSPVLSITGRCSWFVLLADRFKLKLSVCGLTGAFVNLPFRGCDFQHSQPSHRIRSWRMRTSNKLAGMMPQRVASRVATMSPPAFRWSYPDFELTLAKNPRRFLAFR